MHADVPFKSASFLPGYIPNSSAWSKVMNLNRQRELEGGLEGGEGERQTERESERERNGHDGRPAF